MDKSNQAIDVSPDDSAELLECEQWVARPPATVFPFYADVRNLQTLTPPFLRFRVLGCSTPDVGEGTLIDYRLRLHGLPMRWRSCIEAWQPCERFVDRQVRGPYALWQHTHEFVPQAGGTLVRDRVRYRLPLGGLGRRLGGALVRRDLEMIFAYRRAVIAARFGSALSQVAS